MDRFCIDNNLFYTFNEDGCGAFRIYNYTAIGLIAPGRITGQGSTLEEAVKEYMTIALGERAGQKEYLTAYVAEPNADVKIAEAFGKDECMAVEAPIDVELTEVPLGEKVG